MDGEFLMATINQPTNWISRIYENDTNVNATFNYTLGANEVLTSFTVTSSENTNPYGLVLSGNQLTGKIVDYFDGKVNLILKYRDRTSLVVTQVNAFNLLPSDPTTCDLVAFIPPNVLKREITYTQTLVYKDVTVPSVPVTHTITQNIILTVYGTFDSWVTKFKNYVNDSGNFPKLGF